MVAPANLRSRGGPNAVQTENPRPSKHPVPPPDWLQQQSAQVQPLRETYKRLNEEYKALDQERQDLNERIDLGTIQMVEHDDTIAGLGEEVKTNEEALLAAQRMPANYKPRGQIVRNAEQAIAEVKNSIEYHEKQKATSERRLTEDRSRKKEVIHEIVDKKKERKTASINLQDKEHEVQGVADDAITAWKKVKLDYSDQKEDDDDADNATNKDGEQ